VFFFFKGNEEARWDRQLYYFKYILLQIRRTQGQWRQDLAIYLADSTYLADDQQLHNGKIPVYPINASLNM
jgi:hypothetical protein